MLLVEAMVTKSGYVCIAYHNAQFFACRSINNGYLLPIAWCLRKNVHVLIAECVNLKFSWVFIHSFQALLTHQHDHPTERDTDIIKKRKSISLKSGSKMDHSFASSSFASSSFGPALDYSFRNISSLNRIERRQPRQSLRKNRRSPSGR